jgi:hypothetical protein
LVIPGATDTSAVMPFWQAALGYVRRGDTPDEDLVDPRGRGPSFWFEQMEQPRPDGGGAIHIAVWVPAERAEARVAAALAAGGRMVRDEFAPAWWTLADAAGKRGRHREHHRPRMTKTRTRDARGGPCWIARSAAHR